MTDRNIGRNSFNELSTTSSAFELPWSNPGSFQQLNSFHARGSNTDLPPLSLSGADNAGRPVGGDPNIIHLAGGGTKDLRLADQPPGNDDSNGGKRQRLSPQEYAEKLRQLEREPSMDIIKIKKPNVFNHNK